MQSLVHWIIERLDHISRYCFIKYSVPEIIDITRAWLLILKCDIVYLPREITSEKIGISFLLKVHRHYKTYIILLEKRYPILRVNFVICNEYSNTLTKTSYLLIRRRWWLHIIYCLFFAGERGQWSCLLVWYFYDINGCWVSLAEKFNVFQHNS